MNMGYTSRTASVATGYQRPIRSVRVAPAHQQAGTVQVPITLQSKQLDFYTATERVCAFVGGIGSGKTHGLMAYVGKALHRERGRGSIGMICSNTYKQLTQATLPKLWTLLDDTLGLVEGSDYVYNEAPPRSWGAWPTKFKKDHGGILSIRYWGQVAVRSLENIETIRGIEVGWAAIDEARGASREAYDVVHGRVRCAKAKVNELRIATSPNGFDWLYEELVEKASPERKLIQVRTEENLYNPPGYVESLRASYDDLLAAQELEGQFIALTQGRAYRAFDRTLHLGEFEVLPDLPWQVSYDFNRTPFCVLLMQTIDNGDRRRAMIHVVDEVRVMDADTASASVEVARRIKEHVAKFRKPDPNHPIVVQVYGDPSGNTRTTKSNFSDYDVITETLKGEFGRGFVPCWAYSDPGIMERVNAWNAMLKNAAGDVRVRVHPRCRYFVKDMERVVFKPGTRQLDKTTDPSLTHLGDCACYYAAERYPATSTVKAAAVSI